MKHGEKLHPDIVTRELYNQTSNPTSAPSATPFDLLRVPLLGRLLRWHHARTVLQIPLFIVSVLMILHGLLGPDLAPKNLATTIGWVHFRGGLVLILLAAGNFFCLACPFMLVRQLARRFFKPQLNWPRRLRNKWLSVVLFVSFLFVYELFDLWSSPWWTAWLIIAYFAGALVIDSIFKHASFCKFVCPIGQFNFVASTISPLEVSVRNQDVCVSCKTKDCIRGRRNESDLVVIQRGCELALFQPRKVGNLDCTFCLDCVYACPHDNVGIQSRVPAAELMIDPMRSGVGYLSRRKDLAALVLVFSFGALLNALGMISPVYALEQWLGNLLQLKQEAPVLGILFVVFLVIEPLALLGIAAWLSRTWGKISRPLVSTIVRYSYVLVPFGFGVWLAHFCFHFLTGVFTVVPVVQSAAASIGWAFLGEPTWTLTGLPEGAVEIFEYGFLGLGLVGSLLVGYRFAREDSTLHPLRVFGVWATLLVMLFIASLWLTSQPMEMRGMLLGG